ncbi:MAG: hypothetical protein CL843_19820 [Crocinitomicaceae bacterium]|uniref:Rap1a/Tai family immunity protein n=1 Tax=uncultured Thalassospira sp. TaxID=404382 RepID=UPI000C487C82|nr:hypothetical protein [Crocinitomicaceae bacterium]
MMLRLAVLISWLTIACFPARAEFTEVSPLMPQGATTVQVPSAEAMLKFCSDAKPGYQEVCDGYLRGIAEFQEFIWMGKQSPIFCLPGRWTETTMRPVVINFISKNYENWEGRPALGAVMAALVEAFPCP